MLPKNSFPENSILGTRSNLVRARCAKAYLPVFNFSCILQPFASWPEYIFSSGLSPFPANSIPGNVPWRIVLKFYLLFSNTTSHSTTWFLNTGTAHPWRDSTGCTYLPSSNDIADHRTSGTIFNVTRSESAIFRKMKALNAEQVSNITPSLNKLKITNFSGLTPSAQMKPKQIFKCTNHDYRLKMFHFRNNIKLHKIRTRLEVSFHLLFQRNNCCN